ncbi:hypothetical protein FBU30_008480 [Linnemannia zychae]|nr:hypothetical protein FBU30_008480 [Linnemannia zychae]
MSMWCHWSGPMKDTEEHLQSCNFAFEYTCAYRYLGCNFKGGAMDVATHVKNCTFQTSQTSYSNSTSFPNANHTPLGSNDPGLVNPPNSLEVRQFRPQAREQGPMSPPQSSPPYPMAFAQSYPHQRSISLRTGAHSRQNHPYQRQRVQVSVPALQPSTPLDSSPPHQPFKRAGSCEVSQDFEHLSIDDLQLALGTELEEQDLEIYSPTTGATEAEAKQDGGEDFLQIGETDSLNIMDISDLPLSPVKETEIQHQETTNQQSPHNNTQETQHKLVQIVESTVQDLSRQAHAVNGSQDYDYRMSPIITQQIQEEALLIQCGQQIGQGTIDKTQTQESAQRVTSEADVEQQDSNASLKETCQEQGQCDQEISKCDLSTLSPLLRHHLSASPFQNHFPLENNFPQERRRRIIVNEVRESDSEEFAVKEEFSMDEDWVKDPQEIAKQNDSVPTTISSLNNPVTSSVDQLSRRSISYVLQNPNDKRSRILKDITGPQLAVYDIRTTANKPRIGKQPCSTNEHASSSHSTRHRHGSGTGLAAEVFRVLNQHRLNQNTQHSSRRRLSEPSRHSSSSHKNATDSGSSKSVGRFNPLPIRVVPQIPQSPITVNPNSSSPVVQLSVAASGNTTRDATPLASPPPSSSDDEVELEHEHQQRNVGLSNFMLLTQNPPIHLIAEPEPYAFVPFVAYKPRYLKSRRRRGGKRGRTFGLPIVEDKIAHDRYQNLVPPAQTPDITSPENSLASQANRFLHQ